jgi:hypothetical protein
MLGFHLTELFDTLRRSGIVRSKRHFSTFYLGRGPHYLRDVQQRERGNFRVPSKTVEHLCGRLSVLIPFLSPAAAAEIEDIVKLIEQHTNVVQALDCGAGAADSALTFTLN